MNPGRRMLAFALVPLSAVPFIAVAPRVEPAIERRVHELRSGVPPSAAPPPALRALAPAWPGRIR
jgi:hypothetical protein